jgi:16S rRNA G966 N2-methylase RsmD
MNGLYFHDLAWVRHRDEFPTESVDLVYLDPPFDYNALSGETIGE